MADPSYRAAQPGEFFCPAGGAWYMCEAGTKFVGCCMADPCTNGCHGNILRPAGRSVALDSQSPGGSCGGQTPFWTCGMAPTFWGCCNEDPCMNNSTCPEEKLEPTYWDRPDQYEYFKDLNILLSSTAPRSTSDSSPTAGVGSGPSSGPSSAVIGGAVGGTLGFVIILTLVVFFLWRRRGHSESKASSDPASAIDDSQPQTGELASPVSAGIAPPTYSWNINGSSAHQQSWAHNHPKISGNDSKDAPRSPFTELHSKSSLARIAELPGGPTAKEMDVLEITPKSSTANFDNDMAKQVPVASNQILAESRKRTEKR